VASCLPSYSTAVKTAWSLLTATDSKAHNCAAPRRSVLQDAVDQSAHAVVAGRVLGAPPHACSCCRNQLLPHLRFDDDIREEQHACCKEHKGEAGKDGCLAALHLQRVCQLGYVQQGAADVEDTEDQQACRQPAQGMTCSTGQEAHPTSASLHEHAAMHGTALIAAAGCASCRMGSTAKPHQTGPCLPACNPG